MVVRLQRRLGDEEEGRRLVRGGTNGHGNKKKPITVNNGSSSVCVWKGVTFLLVVLLILIVTETIEVKKPMPKETNGQASMGGIVQMKTTLPPSISEDRDTETNVQIPAEATKQPDPTSPPKAPEPEPTNPPTEEPKPEPTSPPTEEPNPQPSLSPTEAPKVEPTIPPVEKPKQEEPQSEAQPQPVANPVDLISARTTERHTYQRRGQPMSEEDRKAMIDKWGQWLLVDDKERPTTDYYDSYPNRDIPRSAFPSNAWQIDTKYLSKFLPESINLVDRAIEAILTEYGKTEGTFEERAEMFELEMYDSLEKAGNYIISKPEWRKDEVGERGGWSTSKSMEGLKRRLLHAVMTEDTFIFALAGHSAAAGHGNLFAQSYSVQVQWIMEAIFARLGVRHQARNLANGGLGTVQHGLAANSVYGPSIDLLMWDSAMTEKDAPALEVLARQAILAGKKVPALWGFLGGTAKYLSMNFDADVGAAGRGTFGIPQAETLEEVEALPWASRYLKCGSDINQICKENKYIGHCWDDDIHPGLEPPTKQKSVPGGQAGWHPGNRSHQLIGRILTFTILRSLKDGLKEWNEAEGYAIPDEKWHVTSWYDNIRYKVESSGPDVGSCNELAKLDLDWTCKYPVKARTEFTPRAYPSLSNIRTLMPPDMAKLVPQPDAPLYDPPENFIKDLHPPAGALDLLNIVEAGVDFRSTLNPDYSAEHYKKPTFSSPATMPFGKGVGLISKAGDQFCDGTADSFCGKGALDDCLLAGTNDSRNGLVFDGFSGWVVLNIPDLKFGYVALKFETWHKSGENSQTRDFTSENGESAIRRDLKGDEAPEYCDAFKFEYAIDGKVTVLSKDEFLEKVRLVQRVVETITILKDPDYTGGQEKEVEVAFRITGCERIKTFVFSHIYWA
ncbi:hypothetical protein IV203_017025 [Nitzschia inconspicua]|uniref:Uncharacterized protein n=1 Tax=Nitzschia inconspicua TaxID=303405 RepID=A0A9K3KR46_9STRA|nr:hypothetical protein IV203_017025 [Nitzschia inconspicua]